MPFLDAPGCRLHYTVDDHTDAWTSAQTVLFVHGFAESTVAWRAWVPHFSRRYRVVRVDQRGFGRSAPMAADVPLTTARFVDDLERVIRETTGGSAHVVAAKSGGISALVLAATRPALAKTVTAICSPVTAPDADGWIEEMERDGVESWARRTQRARMGGTMPEEGIDWWSRLMGATALSTVRAYLNWVGTMDIREEIRHVRCPTLVIGTDTGRRGRSVFEGWQKTIPGSELRILPVDGYHAAGTDPDGTAAITLDFIDRHSTG